MSYSPVPRWVSRPQNVGDAGTQGLELEARFRLDQLIDDAARVELRGNLMLSGGFLLAKALTPVEVVRLTP